MKFPNPRQKIHLNYTYIPTYILPPDTRLHTSTKKNDHQYAIDTDEINTSLIHPIHQKKTRTIFWEYLTMAIDGFGDKKKPYLS